MPMARASHWRLVVSKTAPRRFDSVSSGPKIRKLRLLLVQGDHIPEELAQHQGVLCVDRAGRRHVQGVGPEIRHP